ncbi:hypothetical protein CTEN210_09809 [Chaetoceros tenuissimus]|uniref:Uncharacterized protein n=1 Tax=Chaetoceros tenuissimus TaxID=426638 RepID=A0AAD3CWB2_9STRA|nr:hypothetical protein CTEN210_09809 [Chaetoceros tenuissimus]
MMTQARKRMRLEDGSTSDEALELEPSATIIDMPDDLIKNIFSFVGKGNYCFIGPVSKYFCYNYLTMDVIEDKFAHKLDYLQAIGRNKFTTAEAASFSFALAEDCFLKAPEDFQEEVVRNVASKGKLDILELGHAMGIDVKKAMQRNMKSFNSITQKGDLKMLQYLHEKGLLPEHQWELRQIIDSTACNNNLEILRWLRKHKKFKKLQPTYIMDLFSSAAKCGQMAIFKWTIKWARPSKPLMKNFMNDAAASGNVELVKYFRSDDLPWNLPKTPWTPNTFYYAARSGNIEMLQYLFENECPHDDPRICSNVVSSKNHEKAVELLKWLHEHGFPWDEKTCSSAAEYGNLKALQYMRSKGCPWNSVSFVNGIRNLHFEVVEYCLRNNCPTSVEEDDEDDEDDDISVESVLQICLWPYEDCDYDRPFRMLKLLRSFSGPWDEELVSAVSRKLEGLKWLRSEGYLLDMLKCANYAAEHGDIKTLKWLKSEGFQFNNEETCALAASNDNLEVLQWLRAEGSPVNEETFRNAILSKNVDTIQYCIENDFPFEEEGVYEDFIECCHDPIYIMKLLRKCGYTWHADACTRAAYDGNLKLLRWLRFNGCPWDENVCNWCVKGSDLDMLKYAHENGCPWTKETYAYCFSDEGLDDAFVEIPTETTYQIICSQKVFEYLQKHNCPQPDPNDWDIP